MTTPDLYIDSFGARWQEPPPPRYRAAVLAINLTDALLNPPDDPNLTDIIASQTGQDADVRDYVLATPGVARIVEDAVHELTALRTAANGRPVQLLVNCWSGKHRVVDRISGRHAGSVHIPRMAQSVDVAHPNDEGVQQSWTQDLVSSS
uniref:RapZ C-terminal domain-containing protein n=1 Tax=Streptomyces antimycoticus TaxID=68175 RepID=UPI002F90AF8C|nr:hypothetical protein OG546_50225 [Streptomyces antimycoticus]